MAKRRRRAKPSPYNKFVAGEKRKRQQNRAGESVEEILKAFERNGDARLMSFYPMSHVANPATFQSHSGLAHHHRGDWAVAAANS